MYTVRFHANGIEIKVFDFKVIDSAVIKCFNCVYNYQIYNLAETKRNKIFGRADKFWNLVRMVLYRVNLTNNMKYILSFLVVFFLRSLVFLPYKVQTGENTFKVNVFNKQFNDQEDTFESIAEYIHSDWLTELRTYYRIDWPT